MTSKKYLVCDYRRLKELLNKIELEMRALNLWQLMIPQISAFRSKEPFCIDSMLPHEWLQWVLLPKLRILLETKSEFFTDFSITPYYEEALSREHHSLLPLLKQLDVLFGPCLK